jgi:hypothetical protein
MSHTATKKLNKSETYLIETALVSDEGQTAITEMNGKDLKGHTINVEEGKMKTSYRSDRDRREGFDRGGRGDRGRQNGFDRGGRGGRRY